MKPTVARAAPTVIAALIFVVLLLATVPLAP